MIADLVLDDGGRAAAGFRGDTGDCVVRALAIAAEVPYAKAYAELSRRKRERSDKRGERGAGARTVRSGVPREVYHPYFLSLGLLWAPTMFIGSGTRVHLQPDELPAGRLIVRLSRHLCAVIDGAIHDTGDPRRPEVFTGERAGEVRETRCVYGYYRVPS